jgi:hypothetical protein
MTERKMTMMEKKERLVHQRKQANTLIICDMIRLQIRLKSVLSGLNPSPRRKMLPRANGVGTGIQPARFQLDNQKGLA